jgi:hypothetical protein
MTLLNETLSYIRYWLERNYRAAADQFSLGVSTLQIEEALQPLPFKLPLEVYELYQWSQGSENPNSRGHIFGLQRMLLLRLQSAIENFFFSDQETFHFLKQPLFPIFEFDGEFLCVIGSQEQKQDSPIIYVSEELDTTMTYVNLTSMFLTMADHFKAGLTYEETTIYDPNVKLLEYRTKDERSSLIYQEHNSALPELAISAFCNGIKEIDAESLSMGIALDSFNNQITYLKSDWKDLTVDQLSPELREKLSSLARDDNSRIREVAIKVLERLNPTS